MPNSPVTRKDVARLAGVSPTAVSLILNDKADQVGLAVETRRRVLDAARELRYVPNATARALVERQNRTVGIVTAHAPGSLHLPIFEDFAVAAIGRAAARRHFVTFLPTITAGAGEALSLTLRNAQVDGVIVHGNEALRRASQTLVDWGLPTVCANTWGTAATGAQVVGGVIVDQVAGGRLLARHLRQRGHTRIGILSGEKGKALASGPPRFGAFVEELGPVCIVEYAPTGEWSPQGGYAGMRELLARDRGLTAIFAGNDLMAGGAMRAAREAGRRIPEDLAIAGFGNFRMSAYLEPPLTTVHWPIAELGTRAIDILLAHLNGARGSDSHVVLPTELVVRAST